MQPIILASTSPRRREILAQIGVSHRVVASGVDETPEPALSPRQVAYELARRKAEAVRDALGGRPATFIIAADTVVALDDTTMGKPRDAEEAGAFLRLLSGVTHVVHTAVALVPPSGGSAIADCDTTEVRFADLTDGEIAWYLESGEWEGVAGGYRIQERGACLVESIRGSYSTVVGLPIRLVYSMLASNGFAFR